MRFPDPILDNVDILFVPALHHGTSQNILVACSGKYLIPEDKTICQLTV